MNGIYKILGRISGDAQTEIDAILAHAGSRRNRSPSASKAPGRVRGRRHFGAWAAGCPDQRRAVGRYGPAGVPESQSGQPSRP